MKKIISMFLILTTLFTLCAVTASAAREEEFLSEVALVYEDSVEEARAAIEGTDWKLFEQDLNPNADAVFDDGVYLIYKTSTNVEDAITDLRIMDMYGGYSNSNYEKQLEASREAYMKAVKYIRVAAAEFKELYNAGDDMAKLAYRQMNYYKDIGETNMLMGDFILNIHSDEKLVTVMMEGNLYVVTNLISLLAVGISGGNNGTLANRISAMYEIKDTLSDIDYHDDASIISNEFYELFASLKQYEALSDEYDLEDEEMSEEEYQFMVDYASIAGMLERIHYGEGTLKDFVARGEWEISEIYPIVAALTEGQMALSEMGVFTTVLQYGAPSRPIDELYGLVEEAEKDFTDENGNLEIFDVYMGVDRSIFEGNFAFTTAAERQQALTGKEWNGGDYLATEIQNYIPRPLVTNLLIGALACTALPSAIGYPAVVLASRFGLTASLKLNLFGKVMGNIGVFFMGGRDGIIFSGFSMAKYLLVVGAALYLAAMGVAGISVWHGYYNPNYTPIPDNMMDVRSTDLGDKYVKYTAAKVFGDEEGRNADLNAYQGKEWNALYYTKDATAGNCLTPKFVHSDNDSTIARRHQGISMFGETQAFNLNSHVYSKNAPGVYVTMRYSTTEKAAADMPSVVGSMFATGALYTLTAIGGAGVGIGGTVLIQKARKKKEKPANTDSEK